MLLTSQGEFYIQHVGLVAGATCTACNRTPYDEEVHRDSLDHVRALYLHRHLLPRLQTALVNLRRPSLDVAQCMKPL